MMISIFDRTKNNVEKEKMRIMSIFSLPEHNVLKGSF